jgi:methylmalonyl-CoA mutase
MRALRDKRALVWLAGQPGPLEVELTQAGVSAFIFPGCDALAALGAVHGMIGDDIR